MEQKEVMALFNKRPRNCLICTANTEGDVNVAVYGSPRMIDEDTVVLAVRNNRSYQNLQKNPKAAIIVVEPGEIKHESKAVRVYLEVTNIETDGDLLDQFREEIGARAGKEVANSLQAALRLKITGVRPLIDPIS
jgi:predicted FMN-binding regulatory protein PaiB